MVRLEKGLLKMPSPLSPNTLTTPVPGTPVDHIFHIAQPVIGAARNFKSNRRDLP